MDGSFGSAFPKPPEVYKLFTDANIKTAKDVLETGDEQERKRVEQQFGIDPTILVTPPAAPTSGHYASFGELWPIQERLPTLEELGVKSLVPTNLLKDRAKQLRLMASSLLLNFLQLNDILAKDPSLEKVEHLRLIFVNMHYLINDYRPHQARETLKLLMSNQLRRKKEQNELIKRKCQELRDLIDHLGKFSKDISVPTSVEEVIDNCSSSSITSSKPRSMVIWNLINGIDSSDR